MPSRPPLHELRVLLVRATRGRLSTQGGWLPDDARDVLCTWRPSHHEEDCRGELSYRGLLVRRLGVAQGLARRPPNWPA